MNCETFHDRLHDLASGTLEPAENEALLAHAARCPECEAVLSIEEQFVADRQTGTVENVPEDLAAGMWPAVRARVASSGIRTPGPRPARSSGVGRVFAAAVVAVLLVGAGYVLGQIDLDAAISNPPRTVVRSDAVSAAATGSATRELIDELDRMPDEITLLSAAEAERVLRNSAQLRQWAMSSPAFVDLSDGVQAGEIRALLERNAGVVPAGFDSRYVRKWLRQRV